MTPFECWKLTRDALNLVLNVKIIEAYDKRPGKDRPDEPYASLSLKKIRPLSAPYKVEDKSGDGISATIITLNEEKNIRHEVNLGEKVQKTMRRTEDKICGVFPRTRSELQPFLQAAL